MALSLSPGQRGAYKFAVSRPQAALYCEQRTGKTYITLAILRKEAGAPIDLKTGRGNDFCGILISLLSNRESTWKDKLAELLPWLNVSSNWEEFKRMPNPRLYVMHYEGLRRDIKRLVRYRKINWACIDESHKMGRRGSKQSRAIRRLAWVPRKILLTGTPMEKSPAHLWAQFDFLVPGLLHDRWDDFEGEYFEWREIENRQRPGTEAWRKRFLAQRILRSKAKFRAEKLHQLIERISPYCYRLEKEDVGIERARIERVDVPLKGRQLQCYKQLERRSLVDLGGGKRVVCQFPAVTIMKKRQVASGFVYDDEEELHYLGDAKLDKLKQLVNEMSKPVVIFTAFVPDLKRIHQILRSEGYDGEVVWGKTNKKTRPDIWRTFQRAAFDYLVCQIRVGGAGNDLWKANNAIVHSMNHSFIDWDQMISRLDVMGKKKKSRIVVLCGKETIDEELYDLIIKKRLTGTEVLQQLKRKEKPMAKTETKAKRTPPAPETPKFGVPELATALGIEPASVRVALRKSSLKRAGRSWGWDTQKEFDAAVKELKRAEKAAT